MFKQNAQGDAPFNGGSIMSIMSIMSSSESIDHSRYRTFSLNSDDTCESKTLEVELSAKVWTPPKKRGALEGLGP